MNKDPIALSTMDAIQRYSESALFMLPRMFYRDGPHRGLFAFKLYPEAGQLIPSGASLRYSLIAWVGLLSALPDTIRSWDAWPIALQRLKEVLTQPKKLTVGELGLFLWIGKLAPNTFNSAEILRQVRLRWDEGKNTADTLDMGWLLTGLIESQSDPDFAAEVRAAILEAYNPKTQLFAFQKFSSAPIFRPSRYRNSLGSFASQVYPLVALSTSFRSQPDSQIGEIIRANASRVSQLQGPKGEWWWIYDVRSGACVVDYPVYSIHQDGMGPMALLAAMKALGTQEWMPAVEKSLRYLTDFREPRSGETFLSDGCIWRAVIRDFPGPDPADLPFGLHSVEMNWVLQQGRPALLRTVSKPDGDNFRVLKEARPYCPGWILYAYALAHNLAGTPMQLTALS